MDIASSPPTKCFLHIPHVPPYFVHMYVSYQCHHHRGMFEWKEKNCAEFKPVSFSLHDAIICFSYYCYNYCRKKEEKTVLET